MHTIQINDDVYRLPESWNELTPKQLEFLATQSMKELSVEQLKIYMMLYCIGAQVTPIHPLLNSKRNFYRQIGRQSNEACLRVGRKRYTLTFEEISLLVDLMYFLYIREKDYKGDFTDRYKISSELEENPYPKLRIGLRTLHGPDSLLSDITFEQYMYLQTYLDAAQRQPEKIDQALACLWHSGRQFDINRMERDARLLHRLPPARKLVLIWFVEGCFRGLGDAFPRLFSSSGSSSKNGVFDMQLRLLDSLANSDMTKKDAVRKGFLYDALYSMDETVSRQEEMEKQMNR